MTETWRVIPDWPTYEVSDAGRVRSIDRYVRAKHPTGPVIPRLFRGRVLRSRRSGEQKYPMVSFTSPGRKREYKYVHELVLLVFVGPKPEGLEACHFNDNPEDNALRNLRYDTRKANAADRTRNRRAA